MLSREDYSPLKSSTERTNTNFLTATKPYETVENLKKEEDPEIQQIDMQ